MNVVKIERNERLYFFREGAVRLENLNNISDTTLLRMALVVIDLQSSRITKSRYDIEDMVQCYINTLPTDASLTN